MKTEGMWKMFYKEIEPGSALECLEAQILKLFSTQCQPWWHLYGFHVCTRLPKKTRNTSLSRSCCPMFRPRREETWWMPIHDIITNIDPPSTGSTGQFYCFDCDEMKCVQKLM